MKKLLLSLIVLAVSITSMFAQITAATGYTMVASTVAGNGTDTVTVGSIMPYQVTGDPNMHLLRLMGVLGYSHYTKTITTGASLLASDGASAVQDADSAFSASFPTVGSYTISVTEVPQVVSGPAYSCTANTVTLPVVVVARPKATFGTSASASGCSVDGTTVTIPYTLIGTGKFAVKYRIHYTPLSGTATDVVASNTISVSDYTTTTGTSFNFSYAVPSAAYGRYDVYIEGLTDRISVKSGVATVAGTDYPTSALTFYAYPTPVTQPIQHIKNL